MGDDIYFGICDEYPKRPVARIACQAKAVNGAWQKKNLSNELPPVGKVFSPSLPWIQQRQSVAVIAKLNPRDVGEGNDQLIVEHAFPLRQILDFRQLGMEGARRRLIEEGLVRISPFSNELIVAFSDTQCAVVKMALHPEGGRFVTAPGRVALYQFNAAVFDGVEFDGIYFEVPGITVGELKDETTWLLDQDLLEKLLKGLKKIDAEGPSRAERERIISLVIRAQKLASENTDWAYLQEWLQSFLPQLRTNIETPAYIADSLMETAPIREALEQKQQKAFEQIRSEIEPRVRATVETNLEYLTAKKQKLNSEIQHQQEIQKGLSLQASSTQQLIDQLKTQLTKEIDTLNHTLGELEDQNTPAFQKLLNRLHHVLGEEANLLAPIDQSIPPWSRIQTANKAQKIAVEDLIQRFKAESRRVGVTSDDFRYFDIALRSGALVVLPQQLAEAMIPGYAKVVTGGNFVREPLGPGLLSLNDLWAHPASGVRTGLAHAWSSALLKPERFHLVWLDGLNRTPMDLWLPSLVGAIRNIHRPMNLLLIASVDAGMLDAKHTWSELPNTSLPLELTLEAVRGEPTPIGNSVSPSTTYLPFIPYDINRAEQRTYLNEQDDCKPLPFSMEAELYRAEAMYNADPATISGRLEQFSRKREQGRLWLTKLLEDNE
ncbi:hypothetical protein LCGC14_0087270 [marine sediment metagenome]|uniref:Uncharacterized protein n=1 Tax=marine sediment metagenome TaxID=412755 RepID=A0A0F9YIR7_9ZZZZ|nr:hypothetical protein [Halomonas sp.]HDZ46423.1 hypothetical protein [Halomonas sp.]HEB06203.1 hypothetical protein [Halomonas sp.]